MPTDGLQKGISLQKLFLESVILDNVLNMLFCLIAAQKRIVQLLMSLARDCNKQRSLV